jgi:hypothetical protein
MFITKKENLHPDAFTLCVFLTNFDYSKIKEVCHGREGKESRVHS